jgi:hypothetical protein
MRTSVNLSSSFETKGNMNFFLRMRLT